MCGLAGIIGEGAASAKLLAEFDRALLHRGPDDGGLWREPAERLALVHRRLAIVDLSPLGHQPMVSNDGRLVLAYNGEIYNHLELRRELRKEREVAWRGHSDTETLIECIAAWGLSATLRRAVGMFALALWDRTEHRLSLARDRFGEKPLYYGWTGGDFVFASELHAIRRHPRFDNPISRDALAGLLAHASVAGPLSIYERLFKLQPGCILTIEAGATRIPREEPPRPGEGKNGIRLEEYWSYRDVVLAGLANPIENEEEALDRLEATLVDAVRGQAVADVPVGAFLSGGIDSSSIVALYQAHATGSVKTFTIGFEEAAYNEAEHAKAFAALLGATHEERYITAREAQDAIPLMPQIYDEPFGDSSQVPTYLVSKLARDRVTVALSGDGGDELFGGYNRYFGMISLWNGLRRIPSPARMALGRALAKVPPTAWNGLVAATGRGRPAFFGERVRKVFRSIGEAQDVDEYLAVFLDAWARSESPVLGANGASSAALDSRLAREAPAVVAMMHADAIRYMRDDILVKVDRAAMAVSLETRVPFLDHRVAEVAARIPLRMKIRGGDGKLILKRLLFRHAPESMFRRPKAGFAIPVGEWIRGPLRDWAEAMLDPARLTRQGYFDTLLIRQRWEQHLSGREDASQALWPVLMFQAWLDAHHPDV